MWILRINNEIACTSISACATRSAHQISADMQHLAFTLAQEFPVHVELTYSIMADDREDATEMLAA